MPRGGVPRIPPQTRTIDVSALVRQAWGDEWMKKDTGYEFSNGRKFDVSEPQGGPYEPIYTGLVIEDQNYIPLTDEQYRVLYT